MPDQAPSGPNKADIGAASADKPRSAVGQVPDLRQRVLREMNEELDRTPSGAVIGFLVAGASGFVMGVLAAVLLSHC